MFLDYEPTSPEEFIGSNTNDFTMNNQQSGLPDLFGGGSNNFDFSMNNAAQYGMGQNAGDIFAGQAYNNLSPTTYMTSTMNPLNDLNAEGSFANLTAGLEGVQDQEQEYYNEAFTRRPGAMEAYNQSLQPQGEGPVWYNTPEFRRSALMGGVGMLGNYLAAKAKNKMIDRAMAMAGKQTDINRAADANVLAMLRDPNFGMQRASAQLNAINRGAAASGRREGLSAADLQRMDAVNRARAAIQAENQPYVTPDRTNTLSSLFAQRQDPFVSMLPALAQAGGYYQRQMDPTFQEQQLRDMNQRFAQWQMENMNPGTTYYG